MRKYLTVVLSLLLVLGIAALAYAEDKPEIKLGGKILIRGWFFDNVSDVTGAPVPTDTDSASFYTTNANITLDAKVADNIQGFMELETSGANSRQSGLYIWGSYEEKPNENLKFRQLWLLYTGSGLLGFPAGLKAGHMPLSLGEKQFLNHERFGDDAIVFFMDPTKELHVGLLTVKVVEGSLTENDEIDAYGVLGTYKLDKNTTVGLNYSLLRSDTAAAVSALSLQNLGLHANAKVAGLTLTGEIDVQFGKVGTGTAEKDFSGYGIFAKAGYKIDPINVRASVAYGSGDDDPTDDKIKEFQTVMGFDTLPPVARIVHYTQIYERTIATAARTQYVTGGGSTATKHRNTGIANTTYLNVGADVTPVTDLSFSLDAFLLSATKTAGGRDKAVGTEVDLKGTYKLAKNLSYFVEAGMFMPGDYYTKPTPISTGATDDTVTQVVHGLNLTF